MEPISQAEVLRHIQATQFFIESQKHELTRENIYKAMVELSMMNFSRKNKETREDYTRYINRVEQYLVLINENNREISLIMEEYITSTNIQPSISSSITPFLESVRLLIIVNKFSDKMLRKILSVVIGVKNIIEGSTKIGLKYLIDIFNDDLNIVELLAKTSLLTYLWIKPGVYEQNISIRQLLIIGWNFLLNLVEPINANQGPRDFISKLPENPYDFYICGKKPRRFLDTN
jgi:hypothetical protein